MAHPSDATLQITVGRLIDEALAEKVERLIHKPDERTAGYIQALRDVQSWMSGDAPRPVRLPPTTHPGV